MGQDQSAPAAASSSSPSSSSNRRGRRAAAGAGASGGGAAGSPAAATGNSSSSSPAASRQRKENKMVAESVFDVISTGDVRQLELLLGSVRDYDINAAGPSSGNPPLHHAVNGTLNTVDMVRALVDKGAALDKLNADGESPLIIAVSADREDVVRVLLELGADIDCPSRSGAVPLYYALAKRCRSVLLPLLRKRPNVNFLTEDGESILHAAVRFGDPSVVDAVLHSLRVYPGGKVMLPPLSFSARSDESSSANSRDNTKAEEEGDYHKWTHTVSLLDARSSANWDTPLGIAIHQALNSANSSAIRTRSTEVSQLLAASRTEMLMEDHLDLPRNF